MISPGQEPPRLPATLRECAQALETLLTAEDLERFRATEFERLGQFHMDLGLFLRNNWLRPPTSPIRDRFDQRDWLSDLDGLSHSLIESMWLLLNGRDIDGKVVKLLFKGVAFWGDEPGDEFYEELLGKAP